MEFHRLVLHGLETINTEYDQQNDGDDAQEYPRPGPLRVRFEGRGQRRVFGEIGVSQRAHRCGERIRQLRCLEAGHQLGD
jgi:hypothetical protein